MGSSQYEYMERKRMETEQKEMMCKYKKIICKIFGEQIRVIGESSAIGPMGQFQIRFFYEPTKIYVTLDADRRIFKTLFCHTVVKLFYSVQRIPIFRLKMISRFI